MLKTKMNHMCKLYVGLKQLILVTFESMSQVRGELNK